MRPLLLALLLFLPLSSARAGTLNGIDVLAADAQVAVGSAEAVGPHIRLPTL